MIQEVSKLVTDYDDDVDLNVYDVGDSDDYDFDEMIQEGYNRYARLVLDILGMT